MIEDTIEAAGIDKQLMEFYYTAEQNNSREQV